MGGEGGVGFCEVVFDDGLEIEGVCVGFDVVVFYG